MKNLLIYINADKRLNPEHEAMLKVQLKNSSEFWNPEDVMLAFNFPYEYRGFKAIEVPDLISSQYPKNPRAIINSAVDVIIYLLKEGLLTEDAWVHDFDAFQIAPFDLDLKEMGLVTYGSYPKRRFIPLDKEYETRINFGSVFFKPQSLDIFEKLLELMTERNLYAEDGLTVMLDEIRDRVQILDQSYNLHVRNIKRNLELAKHPIKIVHFPPDKEFRESFRDIIPLKLNFLIDEEFHYLRQSG